MEVNVLREQSIYETLRKKFIANKGYLAGILMTLVAETAISLLLPGLTSRIIDGLNRRSMAWLMLLALLFLATVLMGGLFAVLNTLLCEKAGRRACDELRKDIFAKMYHFPMARHKSAQTGEFLEKIEGDVNILVGFFSNMLIDITGSSFLVLGILVVFAGKSLALGLIFGLLTILIFSIFIGTQKKISLLWRSARDAETQAFGEFTQVVRAAVDLVGLGKEGYGAERFREKFDRFGQKQVRASFLGNIPATIFYSLLNVGEGIALAIGIYLLKRKELTMGDVYLLLSYVGLLNMPFFLLKYQFTQLPMALSAFSRLNAVYAVEEERGEAGTVDSFADGSIVFDSVTFGYDDGNTVLKDVSFRIDSHDKVLIQGRTGGGKSTILHLIAGLYRPASGKVWIGGNPIDAYKKGCANGNIYYISQFCPVMEDTLYNNLAHFQDKYGESEIAGAVRMVHLDTWMQRKGIGLQSMVRPDDFTQDERQLLAWAGAVIASPRILLVDEFDAAIGDSALQVIDGLIRDCFQDTTIVMVSHKNRSSIEFRKRIYVKEAGAEVVE